MFRPIPETLSLPIAPSREFWMHYLTTKIEATIKNEGDTIGWENNNETVGPEALRAKQSLLRVIPLIMPERSDASDVDLYRFVPEHDDFAAHNITIQVFYDDPAEVTSLFDWERGYIVPAILADPMVQVSVGDKLLFLEVNGSGEPGLGRIPDGATDDELSLYQGWAKRYVEV
jgi:hypothetical protein